MQYNNKYQWDFEVGGAYEEKKSQKKIYYKNAQTTFLLVAVGLALLFAIGHSLPAFLATKIF
ncbi:MAG: hypothetical protein ORN57_01070 [Alphaproteobacteria bacterium]|nr:hypothetical protein [Alphaproteobacteria bacterium]